MQLQCHGADYLNLQISWDDDHQAVHRAISPGRLQQCDRGNWFCILSHNFCPFKQSSGPKSGEENAPFSNFLLVENRSKDDSRSFPSPTRRSQTAPFVPLHLRKIIEVRKKIVLVRSPFFLFIIPVGCKNWL